MTDDPERARAVRDLRGDIIDETALAMLGATSAEFIAAVRDRLSRGLPRLVALPFREVGKRHARKLDAAERMQIAVVHGRRRRRASTKKRDAESRGGRCVNENNRGTHGLATHGCRCEACHHVHRRSA